MDRFHMRRAERLNRQWVSSPSTCTTSYHTALRGYVQGPYMDGDDRRPIPQRLADAAVGIHRFWLDHNDTVETSGGEKPVLLSRGTTEERQRRCRGIHNTAIAGSQTPLARKERGAFPLACPP